MCDMIHLTIVCTSTSFNCMYVMLCHVDEWITFQHRENEKLKAKVKIAEKKTKIAEDKANKAKYVCVSQKCVVRPVLLPLAVVRPALPPPPVVPFVPFALLPAPFRSFVPSSFPHRPFRSSSFPARPLSVVRYLPLTDVYSILSSPC